MKPEQCLEVESHGEFRSGVYQEFARGFGVRDYRFNNAGDRLVKWYRGRLRDAFGHVTTAREVRSTSGHPLYYLIFAGPNKTGAVIAQNVLKQGKRMIR